MELRGLGRVHGGIGGGVHGGIVGGVYGGIGGGVHGGIGGGVHGGIGGGVHGTSEGDCRMDMDSLEGSIWIHWMGINETSNSEYVPGAYEGGDK